MPTSGKYRENLANASVCHITRVYSTADLVLPLSKRFCKVSTEVLTLLFSTNPGKANLLMKKSIAAKVASIQPAL
jgi:hypothetical protein